MAKYTDFANRYLEVHNTTGQEAMVRCPYHGGVSMQFNLETGLFICFNCDAKGNFKSLSKELGLQYAEPEVDVKDILARLDSLKEQAGVETSSMPVLPESTLRRYKFATDYWGPCPKRRPRGCIGKVGCKQHRWFTDETIDAFELGYDPMSNAGIIPVRNIDGGLIGVIRRFLDDDVELRYRYPKGFKRSTNLFASWFVDRDPDATTVVLVEGSLDAVNVWQAGYDAMAVYGSSVSRSQVRILRRMGVSRIVLFFDDDAAGKKCTDSALGWHTHKRGRGKKTFTTYDPETDLSREFLVFRAKYGRKMPSDPGAMTKSQIDATLTSARSTL